jgi:sn-glycerol 3-phosphate transport system substrate-binding protein
MTARSRRDLSGLRGATSARRDFLRALAGSLAAALGAGAAAAGCTPRSSDGRTDISLWFSYGGTNREVLLSLVRRFNDEQRAVRVLPTYQGDYFEGLAKLRTALAAKAGPTLTHVVGEVVPYLAEAKVLERLDGFEGASELDLVPELAQARSFAGGDRRPLVCLPFNRSTPIVYYDVRLFEEAGLAPPRTWADLRAVAARLTTRDGNGDVVRWGFECPIDWWFWVALVGQAGGQVLEGSGPPSLGGPAGVAALELWQTLVHEDRSMKPPAGRDYNAWQAANTDFLARRAAMIWTSTAFLRYLETNASFEVGAAPLPRHVRASVPTGGTMFVMPRGSPRPLEEAGFAFLRWMMAPKQANEWATRTGYMPVSAAGRRELESSGYYVNHPNDYVAVAQLRAVDPWPWSPQLFRVQREAVQPRLEEAVLTRRDARATLDEARRAAEAP